MSKNCIFNISKICDNCGECEICELNRSKKCDNCGKCLELEGYDVKAIKIDEVFEHEEIEEILEEDIVDVEVDEMEAVEDKLTDNDEIDKKPKISDYDEFLAEEEILKQNKDEYIPENNETWEYIDDIDGVSELLENDEDTSELLKEKFPGLIILNDRR
ncbi:MAG: hypothetical protein N2B06_15385 [Clostridium sp.]